MMISMTICITLMTMSRGCTWLATDRARRVRKEVLQAKAAGVGDSVQRKLRDTSEFPFSWESGASLQ